MVPYERTSTDQSLGISFPAGESIRRLLQDYWTDAGVRLFALLQMLDILTTLLALRLGLVEGMSFPAALMARTNPIVGLAICKLLAFALAGITLLLGRKVTIYNRWFSFLVLWNCTLITGRAAGFF